MSGTIGKIEWYLARDGQQHGPLTENELDKFIELGHLRPTDLLWRAGFDDWRTALDVFPPPAPPPAPVLPPIPLPTVDEDAPERQPSPARRTEKDQADTSSFRSSEVAATGGTGHADPRSVHARIAERTEAIDRRTDGRTEPRLDHRQPLGAERARHRQDHPETYHDRGLEPVHPSALQSPAPDDYQPTLSASNITTQRPDENAQFPRPGRSGDDRGQERNRPSGNQHNPAAATAPAPQPIDDEDAFLDDEPESRSGWLMVAAAMFILVIVGAGGLFAYNNKKAIAALYNDLAKRKPASSVSVVRAPTQSAKEPAAAALQQPSSATTTATRSMAPPPLAAAPQSPQPIPEIPLLKSKLWQFAQKEFGDWTDKRLEYIQQLPDQEKSRESVNKYLIESFVRFRRDNAAVALQASPASLEQIATSFVDSLKALTTKGAKQCYAFISNGESTPEVAPLYFEPHVGSKLEAQMLAILQAIVDGKTAPKLRRKPPSADDFNKLSSELAKRGWSTSDLKLFSDPNELAKAKPEVVCRLVTEWFSTQTKLADEATRDQLIAASLRPVIGG